MKAVNKPQEVFLGLGCNVGEREASLSQAIVQIEALDWQTEKQASWYQSPALLPKDAPEEWDMPFLNTVIGGRTGMSPQDLLQAIARIEASMGRMRRGHWGPREIDIDILLYGQHIIEEKDITIPHPEMLNRDFVMIPLAEIAPEAIYPGEGVWHGKSYREIRAALHANAQIEEYAH